VEAGGSTVFPKLGLEVKPKKVTKFLFHSLNTGSQIISSITFIYRKFINFAYPAFRMVQCFGITWRKMERFSLKVCTARVLYYSAINGVLLPIYHYYLCFLFIFTTGYFLLLLLIYHNYFFLYIHQYFLFIITTHSSYSLVLLFMNKSSIHTVSSSICYML